MKYNICFDNDDDAMDWRSAGHRDLSFPCPRSRRNSPRSRKLSKARSFPLFRLRKLAIASFNRRLMGRPSILLRCSSAARFTAHSTRVLGGRPCGRSADQSFGRGSDQVPEPARRRVQSCRCRSGPAQHAPGRPLTPRHAAR